MANYAHLPLGHIGGDWVLDTADALFARTLRDADCLLWAVDSTLPQVPGDPGVSPPAGQVVEETAAEVSSNCRAPAGTGRLQAIKSEEPRPR